MSTLFVFLDESGNMDFSKNGTDHFVLAAVTALEPLESSRKLQQLKYDLLQQGNDVQQFHASEDRQAIRDLVFTLINELDNIRVNFIYANKHKTHPDYQDNAKFYGLLGKTLIKYIINGYVASRYDQIVIIFDKALPRNDQNQFLKSVKPEIKKLGKPFYIYFHQTKSDFNGQIADYLAWAKFVSLERSERRPLAAVNRLPKTDFDIFRLGTTRYY